MQEACHALRLATAAKLDLACRTCAPGWSAVQERCTESRRPPSAAGVVDRYTTVPSTRPAVTMAFDPRMIDDLARRLAGAVPENVNALRRDLEQNFKGVLQAQLTRLDLVNREEFDVQSAVLRRTREKLAVLEQRLAEIEAGKPA
jgi:ubiquinone biosynthesis accessory factor UbiK